MELLRDAYLAWRDAADRRSAQGELRPGAEEAALLERFTGAFERCPPELRAAWEAERVSLDEKRDLCRCGHPRAHHDAEGSCFHVVGCATGCACP